MQLAFGLEVGFRKHFTDYLDDVSESGADVELIREAYGEVAAALSFRYIDTISGRSITPQENFLHGNPERKDWLHYINFSFSYNFISLRQWKNKSKQLL